MQETAGGFKSSKRKAESSILADVELTLAKFLISRAVYNGGNFNGVCCRRLVQHAKEIIGEIKPILVSKKENCCEESAINSKMETVEDALGFDKV